MSVCFPPRFHEFEFRKTLNRILPKWEEEALPSIGNLMDPEVLEDLMDTIAHRLEDDPLGLLCPALSM